MTSHSVTENAANGKNVVIWIKSSQKDVFSTHYHKGASYLALLDALARRGHHVFFAYDAEHWRGSDMFSPAAEYRDRALQTFSDNTAEPIRADVIYNLGNIPGDNFPGDNSRARITNTPVFRTFCASKFAVYKYLHEFFPKTILVAREEDFYDALEKLPGDYVVFKPNTGTNGRGVKVLKKDEAMLDDEMRTIIAEPSGALLQEFIDTSKGIPGICATHHDLRIATVNNVIALTHVRTPEPGSLIANYAQGATIHELTAADIPQKIIAFYEKIYAKIAERFSDPMYTMDIGIGANGNPLLFEINGTTAFPWPEFESKDFFIENLVEHLIKSRGIIPGRQ
jgi:glutathione synthase/RimK-type ligase-like ATP-grasp enzyme